MPPRGGLADKIGNRYEGRIAVWRILQLLDEQHDSVRVRFEQPGDDKFRVVGAAERRISHLYAGQAAAVGDDEWTVGTLVSRGVIPAFGGRLGEDPAARCEFFSALSASHLQQMSEDARMAASLAEFETQFAEAANKKESWEALCRAWPDVAPEQAWRRLQRVTAGNIDEQTLRETLRAHAQALVDAPPDDVIARLVDFLDDHLAVELTAHDSGLSCARPAGSGPPTGAVTTASTPGFTTRPAVTATASPPTAARSGDPPLLSRGYRGYARHARRPGRGDRGRGRGYRQDRPAWPGPGRAPGQGCGGSGE